jgi:hypothetical protein
MGSKLSNRATLGPCNDGKSSIINHRLLICSGIFMFNEMNFDIRVHYLNSDVLVQMCSNGIMIVLFILSGMVVLNLFCTQGKKLLY